MFGIFTVGPVDIFLLLLIPLAFLASLIWLARWIARRTSREYWRGEED